MVISSCSWYITKGILTRPETVHIAYIHTTPRYLYGYPTSIDWQKYWPVRLYARLVNHYLREYDFVAARRPDILIANSENVRRRIRKFYRKDAKVVYPPVEMGSFEVSPRTSENSKTKSWKTSQDLVLEKQNYFLIVSRLSPYKKIEIAVEAMNKLNLPLYVIGEGSPKYVKYLKSIAGPKTKFLGWLSDKKTKEHYRHCRAFILPGEEDFGIALVEAMSFGKPVIALRHGGAMETVIEGETGEFFNEPTVEVLADAVRRFQEHEKNYSPEKIWENVNMFRRSAFEENISLFIAKVIS